MTKITVDLQIVRLCNSSCDFTIEVARTLCGMDGVILLYLDYDNAKFTIRTTRDPEEIRDTLQHTVPGISVIVSRRINTPNSSIQPPPGFHDTARDMVDGARDKGLAIVEYKQTTTLKMNLVDQATTASSATNVHDSEHGDYGYANAAPPPQQYPPSTNGSAWTYGRYVPPPATAPPMPKTEGEGYVNGYPNEKKTEGEGYVNGYPNEKKTESEAYVYGYPNKKKTEGEDYGFGYPSEKKTEGEDYGFGYPSKKKTEGEDYCFGYPSEKKTEGEDYGFGYSSEKKYMEDEYYSGGCSTILLCLFYGILILFLVISIKTEPKGS